jgi:putative transposase
MRYRRASIGGVTYFFTVNLAERSSGLLVDRVDALRQVVLRVRRAHPLEILAWVAMPDHIHATWRLPENDADDSTRWAPIKAGFSRTRGEAGLGLAVSTAVSLDDM